MNKGKAEVMTSVKKKAAKKRTKKYISELNYKKALDIMDEKQFIDDDPLLL